MDVARTQGTRHPHDVLPWVQFSVLSSQFSVHHPRAEYGPNGLGD
jgi:hypothetical protein